MPYCFIKTLFLELLLHSGYQGVCVSSGMNLNHLHYCTQWDLTVSHGYWKIGEHVFHLLAIHCRLHITQFGKHDGSLDDSEVNSRHKHENEGLS